MKRWLGSCFFSIGTLLASSAHGQSPFDLKMFLLHHTKEIKARWSIDITQGRLNCVMDQGRNYAYSGMCLFEAYDHWLSMHGFNISPLSLNENEENLTILVNEKQPVYIQKVMLNYRQP